MPNFKKIVNDVKYEERRLSGISYMPDSIFSIVEKYIAEWDEIYDAKNIGVIISDPNTNEIYAMATYPNYDLNTPFTPVNSNLLQNWGSLSSEDQSNILYNMWNNSATQRTYEPGSTFKLVTASVGLEEGIVTTDKAGDFYCNGSYNVAERTITCWKTDGSHQYQSLKQALANSCNPAFMQLGQRIGATTLYKYYHAFGLFERSNPVFYGEASSTFWPLATVGEVELATMSFGQRFNITPLQLVSAVSCIANEGVLVEPQIIKQTIDTTNNAVKTQEVVEKRQVISKETAETMLNLMEYVVTSGTGQTAKVSGYTVGGKSGTSEPLSSNKEEGYVASFIGVAPITNPEIVILVAIYDPHGPNGHHGGQVAGPVVAQILKDVLPDLNVISSNDSNSYNNTNYTTTSLPNVKTFSISEAKKTLKNAGFNVITSEADSTSLVIEQTPKPGTALLNGANVYLYTENSNIKNSVTVPNFKGMSAAQAINSANSKGLNISINGTGTVISQDTASGTSVEAGTVVTIDLSENPNGGY